MLAESARYKACAWNPGDISSLTMRRSRLQEARARLSAAAGRPDVTGALRENGGVLNWENLDPKRVERGIQTLLRRRHPGLRSFDGAGGDGGRDAELISADGRTVFEIKSFGRLTASRRRQVEKSLRAAVESAPDMSRWILVIPMNRTPTRPGVRTSEEAWFDDTLPKLAPDVELEWWGQDWLDDQVAASMDVQRYIEGIDGQVLERSREFDKERAFLTGGADDVHARAAGLARRVDEISMYWTLDVAVRNGVTQTMLRAKDPEAHILDPITITPTFTFRPNHADGDRLRQQFERTLAFGGTVDLPAGYVTDLKIDASDEARLLFSSADPTNSGFTLTSERVQVERPIRCAYQVLDAEEQVISQFPVYLRERTTGARGATLYGSDAAGIATFEVSIPRPSSLPGPGESMELGDAHLRVELPDSIVGYDIASLLPVTETLAAADEGTYIRFNLPGLGRLGGGPVAAHQFPFAQETLEVVSDLHRMEEVTGSVLRFPANVTVSDAADLRKTVRQVDGEEVLHDGGLTLNVRPDAVGAFLDSLAKAPEGDVVGGLLMANDSWELSVGDLTIFPGPAAFWAPHPRLVNRAELEAIAAETATTPVVVGEPVVARFEPTDAAFRWVSRRQAEEYLDGGVHPAELEA